MKRKKMLTIDKVVGTAAKGTNITHANGTTGEIHAGQYVAVRQVGMEEPGVYHLRQCDDKGNPFGAVIASVYVTMRSDGAIVI